MSIACWPSNASRCIYTYNLKGLRTRGPLFLRVFQEQFDHIGVHRKKSWERSEQLQRNGEERRGEESPSPSSSAPSVTRLCWDAGHGQKRLRVVIVTS